MRRLPQFLRPAPVATERPAAVSGAGRYVRSFLFERLVIGTLGVVLPVALVFLDWGLFEGNPVPRDSLSAYYYSGMREWFVLTIGTTGFFLIAYKITEKNLDNTLSIFGGACGLLIPIFSTGRTAAEKIDGLPLTPLQNLVGEKAVQVVHFAASTGFILALGGISILFGRREAARPPHGNRRSPGFWRIFHFACAGAIGAAGIWILVTLKIVEGPYWSLLAGETACAVAFGASWFAKGYEIQYLLGRGSPGDIPARSHSHAG
jgi:hypothetical protein